ncbi:hypothetical protein [Thiohalorhabdus denitrificans]|uniref:Uncharacterized protein n=1 Tax=Thiohalorhabdus denitrificans TaxID=381306 RepID=A0A1G5C3A5_9GAMM|nr:hypothetical protein [Thiohalorhabdus denitrificans]SCX96893.1 hypothetical protein SAMN05661077_0876 [Thiohalorhabdus denitrificans]
MFQSPSLRKALLAAALAGAALPAATPSPAQGRGTAGAGSLACGGDYSSPGTSSVWTIHNLSPSRALTLERMRLYSAGGERLYDSRNSEPPPAATHVEFGVLGPRQAVRIRTQELGDADLIPRFVENAERPLLAVFDWVSDSGDPVPVPMAVHSRVGPGNARTETPCRHLPR